MMTEELNFCSLFFLFASMRETSTANLKKKKNSLVQCDLGSHSFVGIPNNFGPNFGYSR